VKTRLGLDGATAAALHDCFVRDTLAMLAGHVVELHLDAPSDAWLDLGAIRALQVPGDLGARMLAALEPCPALIVGSDSPSLPPSHVQSMLASPGDVVLGPTDDGGYWGILARRAHPDMFAGVEWSTSSVLEQTEAACRRAGLSPARGLSWFDIDSPADLSRLALAPPHHTAEFLRRHPHLVHPTRMALKPGDPAPEIELATDAGAPFRLSSLKGKTVVVYFYPKSDTPGCTTEACEFRDNAVLAKKAVVVGVSPDTVAAQARFKAKYGLPFPLLADADHAAAEAYGVWKEKNMYGKKYMGVERSTFVVGPDGMIRDVFDKVKPAGHAAQVLAALATGLP
jgi:peroxiredoxin Q/BCP